MDVTKVLAAINTAHGELNTLLDAEFKSRRIGGLRRLQNAASALDLAAKHINAGAKAVAPKPAEPAKS